MDKLNKDLIKTKKKLSKVEDEIKSLTEEAKYLQDKLHYYLDSSTYDTSEAEKFIISDFWSKAYDQYKDGGYITDDEYISEVRFNYETQLINSIIQQQKLHRGSVIDIGCGNGRYTKEFAKHFSHTFGMDMSKSRIKENIDKNKNPLINYINADFMHVNYKELGKFDLVFVSDIFTYIDENNLKSVFNKLLKLVNKGGILLIRESTRMIGYEDYKSRNYVAYYRNNKFYEQGFYNDYFVKSYRNFAYNLYHLDKYFNVNPEARKLLKEDTDSLLKNVKKIVKDAVDKHQRTCHFYVYKV